MPIRKKFFFFHSFQVEEKAGDNLVGRVIVARSGCEIDWCYLHGAGLGLALAVFILDFGFSIFALYLG